jgi:homoserine dehydrogenase
MRVEDKPGVLADVTRILADQQISIDAMIQREPAEGEEQTDIIMLTHQTREKNADAAIARIEALPVVKGKVVRLRLEELIPAFPSTGAMALIVIAQNNLIG